MTLGCGVVSVSMLIWAVVWLTWVAGTRFTVELFALGVDGATEINCLDKPVTVETGFNTGVAWTAIGLMAGCDVVGYATVGDVTTV